MARPRKDHTDPHETAEGAPIAVEANYQGQREVDIPTRQGKVAAILEQFKGKGLEVQFDESGSVTFRRGDMSESINMTSADATILNSARRVLNA